MCESNFFDFVNVYNSKIQLIKALNSLDSFRPYGKLLENREEGSSREWFLAENDFHASSTNIF